MMLGFAQHARLAPLMAICVMAVSACAQTDAREAVLAGIADAYADQHYLSGAVLVADENGIVQQGAYGLANHELGVPNELNTRFRTASVAKVFTEVVIMQLREEGEIDLHAPVSRYLRSFTHPDADRITIHHLLSHSSGLPHDFFRLTVENIAKDYSVRELIERASALPPLDADPGSEESWSYSNVNYVLLAAVIESITGESWAENVQRRIFDPVGMNHTSFDRWGAIIPNRAYGYYHAHGVFVKSPEPNMSFDVGGGGVYTTVGDLYLFARALLDGRLMSRQSFDMTFTADHDVQGYAWRFWADVDGYPEAAGMIAHHRGRIEGFTTQLTMDLDNKWVFVSLENIMDGERWKLAARQAAALAGETPEAVPVDHVAAILDVLWRDGRAAARDEALRRIALDPALMEGISDGVVSGTPLEEEMNRAGFTLLEGRRFDEAIEVMLLNQSLFETTSANAQIATGYAYALAGRFDDAEPWVAATRALDPDNGDADEVEAMIAEGRKPL